MVQYSHAHLKSVLQNTKVIAMVGVSPNPVRPSNYVARYLAMRQYQIVPVNPGAVGQELYGATVYAGLADVRRDVDMVEIFRRSEFVPDIVDEAIETLPNLRTIWMQIGVQHAQAAAKAEARGLTVVQNRCPKIEYQRLFGELRKGGFNTGVISSRLW